MPKTRPQIARDARGWRGASAGNLRRFVADFPVAGRPGPGPDGNGSDRRGGTRPAKVRQLSTSFRNTGRVLDAAAALQRGLRINCTQETVLRLLPAMTITTAEVDEAFDIIRAALQEAEAKLATA